ncbi:50S ribosomal protein L1 [Mycoplasma capricolum subsp. capripneumoniae]|uniref:Large ribosomal subunit protein uL1 n=4 Tax=Mycoplasma capricolum TaxID=2095 RepID=RL1_MYCCT|nr:50S ribosomal protein L1 [Mycoplasma capricolum]Q2ST52.1 RecName: Full=Large ribosomal subunit protein uL1; AltName: Full=50S ribosomal protein L1 [Mycoplasma capricolum subsp. capricolum ATCC 27343]ABC01455.1 ribosomal protein L1 [Mycoplasma capricolum subsp. capricolum ATCC 27343]AJK51086.1 50S ribosomal protein L1 [Mycoplasma capricolum subsp. capripneumoniae 87001]AOQ21834.1 50S ribosomal protein L1 [Mycoplasma capricolum subsp. capripneumoniae M1601]AQU77267.1 50S ribosomal protein L1 
MAKISKRFKEALSKVEKNKVYPLNKALDLAKQTATTKFDSTVEVAFNLNIDPRKADQQIRGAVVLPAGTGKTQRVLVLTNTKTKEAEQAKADIVGGEELINRIKNENWFDFDIIVATPEMMAKLGAIGKILGPKGLMPNPKTGTVTMDVAKAVDDIKKGKVEYRADKEGNIHLIIGKVSFEAEKLEENFKAVIDEIRRVKPQTVKGDYIKNITLSTTMGPGIKVEF